MNQQAVTACSRSLGITLLYITGLETLPPAGRVRSCIVNWKQISDDPWILGVVMGYRLELAHMPQQWWVPRERALEEPEQDKVSEEVANLLSKQAIKQVKEVPNQFLSDLFLVPKKDRSKRPVVNL